jgi:hypothetical protein
MLTGSSNLQLLERSILIVVAWGKVSAEEVE